MFNSESSSNMQDEIAIKLTRNFLGLNFVLLQTYSKVHFKWSSKAAILCLKIFFT